MARKYEMQKRKAAAAETRARIIAAAHALLNHEPSTLTLQEVAKAAGITRAAVYKSVGSRRALLAAVFEDQGRLVDFDRVLRAAQLEDPAEAVIETVRESCRAWAVMPGAIRKTLALAVVDAEIGELVGRYEGYRRAEMTALATRAHRAGILKVQQTVDEAAATLTLLTGFAAFDHHALNADRHKAADHLVQVVTAALGIANDAAPRRARRVLRRQSHS
jgi:AcrR family transcriptional regulator